VSTGEGPFHKTHSCRSIALPPCVARVTHSNNGPRKVFLFEIFFFQPSSRATVKPRTGRNKSNYYTETINVTVRLAIMTDAIMELTSYRTLVKRALSLGLPGNLKVSCRWFYCVVVTHIFVMTTIVIIIIIIVIVEKQDATI